jgi:hypothetical protein
MAQRHGSGDFVYVLSAGTSGARESLFKIDILDAEPRHPPRD